MLLSSSGYNATNVYIYLYICIIRSLSYIFNCWLLVSPRFQAQELRHALLNQPNHVLEGLMGVVNDTLSQCAEDASGTLNVVSIVNVLNGANASATEMWRLYLSGKLDRPLSLKMRGLAAPLLK